MRAGSALDVTVAASFGACTSIGAALVIADLGLIAHTSGSLLGSLAWGSIVAGLLAVHLLVAAMATGLSATLGFVGTRVYPDWLPAARPRFTTSLVAIMWGLAMTWINAELLLRWPTIVLPVVIGFTAIMAGSYGFASRRQRMPGVVVSAAAALGVMMLLVNAGVARGSNASQHLALTFGVWAVWLPVGRRLLTDRLRRPSNDRSAELDRLRTRKAAVWAGLGLIATIISGGHVVLDGATGQVRSLVSVVAPNAASSLLALRPVLDLDGDGHPGWLGGSDCAPFDAAISPVAVEVAGDGIDQNCVAGDPTLDDVKAVAARLRGDQIRRDDSASRGPAATRIVLITIDALRHDVRLPQTRRRLGDRCREFRYSYTSNPQTTYAFDSLFRSRFPSQAELVWVAEYLVPRHDRALSLAGQLAAAGFATGAIAFHHRFDPRLGIAPDFASLWTAPAEREVIFGLAGEETTQRARVWLAEHPSPSFLWVHYYDPHAPYLAHDLPESAPLAARYGREVAYTDSQIVGLVDELLTEDDPGLALVLTADHGEAFGEHGAYTHASSLFEEQVRTPTWVCPPRGSALPSGGTVASIIDIAPTILDLAHVRVPESFVGRSLLAEAGPGIAFLDGMGSATAMHAVVVWPWKLIRYPEHDADLLFDLHTDPGERDDRAATEPEVLATMRAQLDAWSALVAAEPGREYPRER